MKIFKTLQYNSTRIFDINSSNMMFCSMHDFISKTLLPNPFPPRSFQKVVLK